VCVTVVNGAAQPAQRVRFAFEYADSRGGRIGSDELDVSGTFLPGVEYGLPGIPAGPWHPYCRALSLPAAVLPRIQEIRVSVREIDYDDGSAWHAADLPPASAPR
jgi:hypothetical protein